MTSTLYRLSAFSTRPEGGNPGEAMGRPSRLKVQIPVSGGIVVSGAAVRL